MDLQFAWDEDKAKANLAKHRVSFLTAAEIFANQIMERIDDREDYGEIRLIALGRVETEVYRVVFTWRDEDAFHRCKGFPPRRTPLHRASASLSDIASTKVASYS